MTGKKTSTISVRVNEDIKKEAENILSDLGISHSAAIDMFYRQIIINKGIPFDISLKSRDEMTKEDFDKMLSIALEQAEKEETTPIKQAFEDIRKA